MHEARVATRLRPFGATVFAEITRRAEAVGAINLGQGFPNFDGPGFVKEAAVAAIREGHSQYAPTNGIPQLTEAIAKQYGFWIDQGASVTVTSGCTEALAATFLGLLEPGDEVVLIEPTYDAYPAGLGMAGAVPHFLTLRPPGFDIDLDELRSLVTRFTRAIVINTPHNPSGKVFSRDELGAIAEICQAHDLVAICDEVYEHMVYDGEHVSIASLPGMADRTITLSSLGKTFSLTGWKVGWAVAPVSLTAAIRAAHQFLTFATATPLQHAAAAALNAPPSYYKELTESYRRKRDLLSEGLTEIGFEVFRPSGTYFLLADHSGFGDEDDVTFVHRLIDEFGVAAIPPSAFYHDPAEARNLVRFAFCKDELTLTAAVDRMRPLRSVGGNRS